ncbi:MAG: sensor domain-containing diguanylate cyclase, partial [Firmicutes bacterium]|nr:sensor domain-containing diguanylate cyclase [Bacillota bacterium]
MIGLIIYILFELILVGIATYNQQNKINELYRKSNTVQAQIEKVFQSTITISDGYLSFMKSNLDATKEDTEQFLNHLLSYEDNYIKNIALIEDTTIKYNYPYEQNQASIGIDLSTIEGQRDDVLFVKNNTVSLFDGPVELVQGGQAFIIRIPIIDGMVYWGQISVVIDADQFIQIIQNSADVNDVNVKITDSLSKEQVLLFGEDLDEDSASTQYENKYFSWDIEVTEANTQSHLVIDLVTRLVGMLVILILCQFLYKSILLNQTILYNGKHDSLTGDYNRAKFIRDYEENRFNGMLIAFTDVNKFKTLNDTLGHLFGDWCLIQLSKSFHQLENIRTYRISGDEFILVSTIPMTIADFKEKIKSNRFVFYNPELKQNIDIDISIGVLENLIESIDLESMLMYLDYAMYDAKKENKEFTVVDQNLMTTYDETKVIEQHLIDDVKK